MVIRPHHIRSYLPSQHQGPAHPDWSDPGQQPRKEFGERPRQLMTTTRPVRICLGGHLESRWAAWFDGITLTHGDDGSTVLTGPVVDQAALHGLFSKLRDLGLPLISVT